MRSFPKISVERIIKTIDSLKENPFPNGYKKLEGVDNTYRIRSGDYRIIYTVHHNKLVIHIIRIADRKNAYD